MSNQPTTSEPTLIEFTLSAEDLEHKRLDKLMHVKFPNFSRSYLQILFEDQFIKGTANGKPVDLKLNKLPPIGTLISVLPPIAKEIKTQAENIPLEILHEDDDLIIINKKAGMVVHPAAGNWEGTLVSALLHHCPNISGVGNEKRPGIVHRLDKGTSGVMVVAKNQSTHQALCEIFAKHDLKRVYECLAVGFWKYPINYKVETTIGRSNTNRKKMQANVKNGKKAISFFHIKKQYKNICHIECKLETGRTHQIRVHLSQFLHLPIVNDGLYGRSKEDKTMSNEAMKILEGFDHPLLHAKTLGFTHPQTKEYLEFTVEPESTFINLVEQLDKEATAIEK